MEMVFNLAIACIGIVVAVLILLCGFLGILLMLGHIQGVWQRLKRQGEKDEK